MAVVDGRVQLPAARLGPDCAGLEEPTEEWDAVEMEAKLGGDVRRREEECNRSDREPCDVAGRRDTRPLAAAGTRRPDRHPEGDRDAEDRRNVRPLRVEVTRRLDPGQRNRRA